MRFRFLCVFRITLGALQLVSLAGLEWDVRHLYPALRRPVFIRIMRSHWCALHLDNDIPGLSGRPWGEAFVFAVCSMSGVPHVVGESGCFALQVPMHSLLFAAC